MTEILQLTPPVALALALNLVGYGLKKSPLPNWVIPFVLIVLGASSFPFIADVSKINYQCKNPEVLDAIYGACIGGLSIGMNQALKGFLNRKNGNGDTTITTKPPTETK